MNQILEVFINLCFLTVLVVGFFSFLFSNLWYRKEGKSEYYRAWQESVVGWFLSSCWFLGNGGYWYHIFKRKDRIKNTIDNDEQLGWLSYENRRHMDLTSERLGPSH